MNFLLELATTIWYILGQWSPNFLSLQNSQHLTLTEHRKFIPSGKSDCVYVFTVMLSSVMGINVRELPTLYQYKKQSEKQYKHNLLEDQQ